MREIKESISENLNAQKIVIIADTCHSASIEGGRRSSINSTAVQNKFFEELAKSEEGTAFISSADANEVAFEDKKWGDGRGVFTHFLLEGLRGKADGYGGGKKDGIISIGELFEYVRHNVKENTEHKQHPSIGTSPYDRNLPLYFTNYILESLTDFSSSISFSSIQERLEYIVNLLQNGQVNDFNNLRKNEDPQIYLPNIDLSDKNLLGIDLHESFLPESIFKKTKMKGANLTGAILTKADLTEADLRSADLSGAKLDGAKLVSVKLQGANLKGMINFSNADLTGADLRGVDLDGMVNFEGAILHNVDFEGSNIDKVDKVLLRLNGADIKNVNGLPSISKPSNKYSIALKHFSENISDLFNKYSISVDNKKIIEELIKQLVKNVESIQSLETIKIESLETIKNSEKGNLQIKIKSLIQMILKVLPLEIQISESFSILTPLNEFLDDSNNITINQLVEYEIQSLKLKNEYEKKLLNIIRSDDHVTNLDFGQDLIILASSESDAVSRERNNCIHHYSNDLPHTHGAFSFHLIEGLDGKADYSNNGIITIYGLKKYIEEQMKYENRRKIVYHTSSWDIENIIITKSQEKFNARISALIKDAKDLLENKDPKTNFVDIFTLEDAAHKVEELIILDPKNKEIPLVHQ